MKKLLSALLILLINNLWAQSASKPSEYEKFISNEGSIIITSEEEIFSSGGIESLDILRVEARNVTTGSTAKAIVISASKSNVYLSKKETEKLVDQMKKIQLLLVDGEIDKDHAASLNIRNTLLIEISYNESKKVWKYSLGVAEEDRKKMKEVTATEFQDIKNLIEEQLSKL